MEKKKNIIYIYGKDLYGCELERDRLRDAFRERHDSSNIDSLRIEEVKDWGKIQQDMLTFGLFAEKRLFLISGGYASVKKSEEEGKESKKEKKNTLAEDTLIHICENISDDHFVIFYSLILPPRSKLREWLGTHASERKFDMLWLTELWNKRFPHLREDIVEKVISSYKKIESSSEELRDSLSHSIAETYMKLSLLETISPSDLETSIIAESSGKIFDFTDAIMRGNSRAALDILHVLLETMNIYAFIGSIIGLLRGSVYTKYLKSQGKSMREIGSMISLHSFVIQKSYESRIPYEKLRDFYDKIIASNIVYRSGYGLSDPELGRIFTIERAIMGLKNQENP